MAESRQQLIQGSSFFQRQKEKLGNFMAKRSTISGAAFKKGTSQEISQNIDKRVGNNERKISLIKNIIKTRKDNVDKKLGSQSTLLDTLQSIAESVDSIRDTLIQRQESGEEGVAGKRVKAEQEEFDKREKGLGKKDKFEGLKAVGSKILKPVMSIWERIWNFIKTIFLGKILLNFLKWFADPANQKKIASFGRFIKNFWPALLTGALLFMTGLGAMITNMTVAIALWIPKMLAAIAALKAKALLGGAGMMGFGRKAVSAFGKTRRFNEGGIVPGSGNSDTVPAMLTPGEVVMNKAAVQQYGTDTLLGMNAAAGGNNKPSFSGGMGGGKKIGGLPGLGGGGAFKDILFGEKRMTAHDKWMEMAGGGLVQYFNKGGEVTKGINSYNDPEGEWQQGGWAAAERELNDPTNTRVLTSPATLFSGATYNIFNKDGKYIGSSRDPALARKERIKLLKEMKKIDGDTKESGKHEGVERWREKGDRGPLAFFSFLDWLTGGLTDMDQMGSEWNLFNSIMKGRESQKEELKEEEKEDKTKLKEEKKEDKTNLILADEQETKSSEGVSTTVDRTKDAVEVVTATQVGGKPSTVNDSGGSGNEVPSFDVGVTRDVSKIRTLGLMLI